MHFTCKTSPKPSHAYDTYWHFAAERQKVFIKRMQGMSGPWTTDPVISAHRFTNVYRAADRVSQYLIRDVIYSGNHTAEDQFFRIIFFKLFNRISTWEHLQRELGEIRYSSYSFKKYDEILSFLTESGNRIYSAAYMMASGRSSFGEDRKHRNHLKLLEKMMTDTVPDKLIACKTMEEAYLLLLRYPLIGSFLAYQYVIDLNYSTLIHFSEMEFVKAGPGARDGIIKCFRSLGDYSFEDIIRYMADRQELEFDRLGLSFNKLWGRKLQLIDCQNIFCETDKYCRVLHPELTGLSGRKKIKQKFSPQPGVITCFFPPKWNINELIKQYTK